MNVNIISQLLVNSISSQKELLESHKNALFIALFKDLGLEKSNSII